MFRILPVGIGCVAVLVLSNMVWYAGSPKDFDSRTMEDFSFVQLCDTQIGFGGFDHDVDTLQKAVRQINALEVDFVLLCGDMVRHPEETENIAALKAELGKLTMPCHLVPGNHDIGHPQNANGVRRYREIFGDDYYGFDHKGHRFLVVNTSLWKMDAPEELDRHNAWLDAQLHSAQVAQRPVIAAGHYPFFALHPMEPDNQGNVDRVHRHRWLESFAERGVTVYLSGHAHANFSHTYRGMKLVTTASTSFNFDGSPMAFRLWHIGADGTYVDRVVEVEGAKPPDDDLQRRSAVYQRQIKKGLKYVFSL